MKSTVSLLVLFVLFFSFLNSSAYAQDGSLLSEEELQKCWDSNIKAIIDLDTKMIIQQTNFPLIGNWHDAYFSLAESVEEQQEDYRKNPGLVFDEGIRAELDRMSWTDLSVKTFEEEIYLELYVNFHREEESYDSFSILQFSRIGGQWMLTSYMYDM